MVESQTRLQRLQRQRQRANQRHARTTTDTITTATVAAAKKTGTDSNNNCTQQSVDVAKKTPAVASSRSMSSANTTSTNKSSMPGGNSMKRSSGNNNNNKTPLNNKESSSPSFTSETTFHNQAKTRSNANSALTSSSRRAAAVGKKVLHSRSTSSSSTRHVHDEEGFEIVEPSVTRAALSKPSTRKTQLQTMVPRMPNENFVGVPTEKFVGGVLPLPPPPPLQTPPKAPSPKSFARYDRSPAVPPPSINNNRSTKKSANSKEWFQYTNGTQSGGVTSSSSSSKPSNTSFKKPPASGRTAPRLEKPRTMEELQFYNERYAQSQDTDIAIDEGHTYHDEISTLAIGNSSVESCGLTLVQATESLSGYRSKGRLNSSKRGGRQLQQPVTQGSNDATPIKTDITRKSTSSMPSDEEISVEDSSQGNKWKEMPRVNLDENKFKNMPRANSYKKSSIHTDQAMPPSSSLSNKNNDNMTPPWASRTSDKKSNSGAPSRIYASSKFNESASNKLPVNKQQQPYTKPTKQKLLSKPMNKVGNAVELPPTANVNAKKGNKSISIRHGGTPVWMHTSILQEKGDMGGNEWEWVRGYLHASCDSDDSVEVTVDDPNSSTNLDGNTYTISKKYNDGAHILMGNSWWSSQPSSSPSPTSVSQPLDALTDADAQGMPPGDLVEMTHLHEPAIVHALLTRYTKDIIYTNTGAILLALNPFKKLDHLYTREMMELYWKNGFHESGNGGEGEEERREKHPPHAYAVAERAYSSMLRSLEERDELARGEVSLCNQAILVSGESGAGKTVTTKIIMRYLSILSQRHSDGNGMEKNSHGGPSVEMQVLQSNPVLESFGNARTIRNDNSSRFGKFIEMSFQAQKGSPSLGGQRGSLLGATIDFYLLEKVRLVSVNPGERNYHIFYELLSPRGMSINDKRQYMLTSHFGKGNTQLTVNDFNMTSISGTFDRRDGVDDSDTYGELRTAMNTVGFSLEEQDGIFSVVSALLHASNLKFVSDGSDDCVVYDRDGTSEAVSSLLGVSEDSLKMALTTSILEARGELLMKRLSTSQAEKALEATVKATYGAMFAYIVTRINKSIEVQGDFRHEAGGRNVGSNDVATIGVLDIFGFESFENNSFEQLCINYCNEALQQQFNRFVFKAEQAEYEYEGIEWSNIEFPDNQEALDLIEAKRLGIFSVLDEQCRLPRRTDQTFAKSVYDTCESNSYFSASRMQRSKGRFAVTHFAGEVEYDSNGFMEKNKDELPKGASDLLASSTFPLISELAYILKDNEASPPVSSGDRGHAPMKRSSSTLARTTVSGQFTSQLKGLRSRVELTEPHYIRCLKPNDRLVANYFDESLIGHQLNCAGVLPAMKIARAGFAMRYLHTAFIQRYRSIAYQELGRRSRRFGGHQLTCQVLISLLSDRLESEMEQRSQANTKMEDITDIVLWGVQVGKSKVFLRTTAFEALEELRNCTMNKAAVMVQARGRAFLCQNKFYLILGSVLTLQCAARKLIACLHVRRLRFNERSITVQKHWRSYYAWYRYQNVHYLTTWCQKFWRGGKVRERFVRIKKYRSAIAIQSAWRYHVFQQCHQQLKNAAIMIQCFFRICVSTRILKQLKREAKDVQTIAMERDKLRMEMRQMKRELEHVKNRHKDNNIQQSDSWTTARSSTSQEEKIRLLSKECVKKDNQLHMLRQEVESLRGSGRSVPSTLPLTVTVDTALPSSRPARFSPVELSLLPSGESSLTKSVGVFPTSPCLLDSEVEDIPQLECSQTSLPDSSIDNTDEKVNMSALNQTTESSFVDCIKIDELPFHQAVQNYDEEMLLDEIQNSSDIELGINSADAKGRTPLHIAVQCSNLEFVEILLSHGAVANTQDFSGNTALHYADSPEMTQILLEGGISPNIPNGDGLCSLHLAVKRRDFNSVKHLVLQGANVNNADDQYWYTSLHLVAHADSPLANTSRSLRGPIAELLCEAKVPPDLNYQDRDGNSPLHHAASLVEEDAGILISLFIEHGSCPKIANNRGQTPIHLFCHNHAARQFVFYHEALHLMLARGADPNKTSLSGCTALHLALYHRDVLTAALLVRHGAQVNMKWKKPLKWERSWTDMGSDDVLPLDMLEDIQSLHTVLTEISTPQIPAPRRLRCMHCKVKFGMFARHHNCTHCGRSVCGKCCVGSLSRSYFPTLRNEEGNGGMFKACSLCEPILLSKVDRVPTTIVSGGGCDQSSIGTISM